MNALIVYGSLINKSELVQNGFSLGNTRPAIVQGFKRVFHQEPSWRKSGQGEERAVLNVVSSQPHWFNGLLVSNLDDGFFVDLDERERGYNRIRVAPSYLQNMTLPIPLRFLKTSISIPGR
jgi:hypothetical protein